MEELENIGCIKAGELHGGRYDKYLEEHRRVYSAEGLSPTVHTAGGGGQELKVMEELIFVGGIGEKDRAGDGKKLSRNYAQGARVYSEEGLATALSAQPVGSYGGATSLYLTGTLQEPVSCASRGRPTAGGTNQQKIEPNGTNANSITTVQKDSMVCEPPKQEQTYRIRALTERECFRLMGVKEEDYQKIASHQSRSSQAHLAGDSIVTTCLMAIFGEMFESVDYRKKIEEVAESVKEDMNERD